MGFQVLGKEKGPLGPLDVTSRRSVPLSQQAGGDPITSTSALRLPDMAISPNNASKRPIPFQARSPSPVENLNGLVPRGNRPGRDQLNQVVIGLAFDVSCMRHGAIETDTWPSWQLSCCKPRVTLGEVERNPVVIGGFQCVGRLDMTVAPVHLIFLTFDPVMSFKAGKLASDGAF